MKDGFTIGELARRCGVSRDAVRFYERERLMPRARRTPTGYRLYGPEDEERLRFIRRAQGVGLTLEDITELIRLHEEHSPAECRSVAERLLLRVEALDRKIAELVAFRRILRDNLRRCEAAEAESCPVVLDLMKGPRR
jgi:MerR family mercuric resistance operon transcriptional regulator/MerR family gold-responsive transcriptional activator of gol and ges genes